MPHVLLKRQSWLRYQRQRPASIRKIYQILIRHTQGRLSLWRKVSVLLTSIRLTRYVPYHQGE